MRTDLKFTYREYRALPETGPRYQLVEGELRLSPSPNFFHSTIVLNLLYALENFMKTKRLGIVRAGPLDVILSDENVFVPDIVYVSNARRKIIAPEGLRGAPDLCVEVLSPSNKDLDRETKRVQYARSGVTEYWIVDPDRRTLELFRLQEQPHAPFRILGEKDALVSELLPGFSLPMDEIFVE